MKGKARTISSKKTLNFRNNIMETKNKFEEMPKGDFHVDLANPKLVEILGNPELSHAIKRAKQLTPEGLRKVDLIFASVYRRIDDAQKAIATEGDPKKQESVLNDHHKIIEYYRNTKDFKIIEKPQDLGLPSTDKTNIVLHLECGDIVTDPDIVEELFNRGVRSIGPMYNHDNHIGGGAKGDLNRGLSAAGKRIIDRMIQLGMIIDVAHANRRTSADIIERARDYQKVVATHTGLGTPSRDMERFITPKLLQEIAKRGGVVGMVPAKPFFPKLEKDFADGMKKASDLTSSADNLAIGSDFGGFDSKDLYEEMDEIGKLSKIAEILSEKGRFSDNEIAKIMFGNIERLVKSLR
jgi:membrane dipeptidase